MASLFAAPERTRARGAPGDEAAGARGTAHDHAPYALSQPGGLEAPSAAGLRRAESGEVDVRVALRSIDDALIRALLCSAGGARAREAAGEAAARATVHDALRQFEDADTGVVEMLNTFRWVAACR